MNKDQLTARAKELGIDTEALNAANNKGTATNAELKDAITAKEAELNTAALQKQAQDLGVDTEGLDTDEELQAAIDNVTEEIALIDEAASLEIDATEFTTHEDYKKAIAEKKAEIKKAEKAASEKAKSTYTDREGREWKFTNKAPKTINIDGRPMTQAEILDNEDIISELAYGNSSFLTQNY